MSSNRTIFSLLDVTRSIQKTLAERYTSAFWVKAEMNKLNFYPHSGHCYPELVEKKDGKIIAEIRSNLWKDDYDRINKNFQSVLKEPLKSGITILFQAKVSFDPIYGLSLRILDIDPGYSLGELEREKQETIQKLKMQGLFNANQSLPLALLPKRIAIISVETSKGLSDFMEVIGQNSWGYAYFHMLFPAILQGDKAAVSIIRQLNRIRLIQHHFDAVAIIRGGGGEVGLTCYNNYELVKAITLFPLPVITGIGHSTNETVSEMVAYRNAITPTALGGFLLQQFHNFAAPVQKAADVIPDRATRFLHNERLRLVNNVRFFKSATNALLASKGNNITQHQRSLLQIRSSFGIKQHLVASSQIKLSVISRGFIKTIGKELDYADKHIALLNPKNILKRGYSITTLNGKVVHASSALKNGDVIKTAVADGSIISTVQHTDNSNAEIL